MWFTRDHIYVYNLLLSFYMFNALGQTDETVSDRKRQVLDLIIWGKKFFPYIISEKQGVI